MPTNHRPTPPPLLLFTFIHHWCGEIDVSPQVNWGKRRISMKRLWAETQSWYASGMITFCTSPGYWSSNGSVTYLLLSAASIWTFVLRIFRYMGFCMRASDVLDVLDCNGCCFFSKTVWTGFLECFMSSNHYKNDSLHRVEKCPEN